METVMFEKNKLLRALLAAGLTTGLVACGGGDDDGSASGGGLPSSDRYVAGTFMDASVNPDASAFLRSAGPSTVGQGGDACSGETNYFETEDGRVRVYGSTAFSETDFRVVSTMIHERLDSMIAKFGMTWAEFVDQRAHIIRDHLSVLVQNYDPALLASGGPTDPTDPTDVSNEPSQPLTDADRWAAWNALSLDEQIAFAELMVEPDRDFRLPRTVLIACLNPDMGGSMFGEGTQIGINVPPNTSTYHSRVGEIFE